MAEFRYGREFREQYAETPYPFSDAATLLARTGQTLPRNLFVDASLYPVGAAGGLYLSRIQIGVREATLEIADTTRRAVARAVFDPVVQGELISVWDLHQRPAGVLVSTATALPHLATWPSGEHAFEPEATPFVSRCVSTLPGDGVRGLTSAEGSVLTGDVLLVGDRGVVLRQDPDDPQAIRIDMVGDPLFLRKLCQATRLFTTPNFIRYINGCPPDAHGNFQLTVGDHTSPQTIVRIRVENGQLVISAIGNTFARS